MNSDIFTIRKKLKSKMDPMRYEHSLSVSFTCIALAMRYDYDLDKAELAGLLHDCAKKHSDGVILKKCIEHGIDITEEDRRAIDVIHAKYGEWLAWHKYGISDKEILSAIRWHTTGKADMSLLDKIVYTADYIESRRYKADNLNEMRKLAFIDLDEAVYEIIRHTLEYLKSKGLFINSESEEAYEYYKKQKTAK